HREHGVDSPRHGRVRRTHGVDSGKHGIDGHTHGVDHHKHDRRSGKHVVIAGFLGVDGGNLPRGRHKLVRGRAHLRRESSYHYARIPTKTRTFLTKKINP